MRVIRKFAQKCFGMSAPKPELINVVENGERRIFYIEIPSMDKVGFGKLDANKFFAQVKELMKGG